jgi:hypothetical protein
VPYGKKTRVQRLRPVSKAKTNRRKPKNLPTRIQRKTSSTKTRKLVSKRKSYGSSSTVRVRSNVLNKNLLIERKTTDLSRGITLKKGGAKKIVDKLSPYLEKHNTKLGKSYKNFKYVKIKYHTKVNGKKVVSYFSTKVAKVKNNKELKLILEMTVERFEKNLDDYRARGFGDIKIDGLVVQGYKLDKKKRKKKGRKKK